MRLSSILATLLFLSVATPAYASFSDVPPSHPNYDAINYVQAQGIVSGYPDGTYRPDQSINRAEFTKIIIEATLPKGGDPDCGSTWGDGGGEGGGFIDVNKHDWFVNYVCRAWIENIVQGYEDGFFRPGNPINFVEAAKIIALSFNLNLEGSDLEAWYKPHVLALENRYAIPLTIKGFAQNITRGEMAEMIYRLKADIDSKSSKTYEELVKSSSAPVAVHGRDLRVTADGVDMIESEFQGAGYVLPYDAWLLDGERFKMTRRTYGECFASICYEDTIEYDFRTSDAHSIDTGDWIVSPDETKAVRVVNYPDTDPLYGTVSIKNVETGKFTFSDTCTYKTGYQNAYTGACFSSPVWSPDSRSIAMHDDREWGDVVVLSANAANLSNAEQVGNIKIAEAEVRPPFLFWSPDSSKLLGFHEYKVISLVDDEEANLGAGGNGVSYNWWRWSPDSTSLLIPQSYSDNTHAVTIERSDGSLRTTLMTYKTAEAYTDSPSADWSPDGSKVAVTNGSSLLLFDLHAQTRTVLSNDGTRYSDVRWSPNGSRILYIKDGNVWVYEL